MASLTSTSTGELFESTVADIESGTVPTTRLSPTHPFRIFWQDFLNDLVTPGFSDPVVDAYVAVFTGDSRWRIAASSTVIVERRRQIRNILHDNPPNVVVVDQPISEGYGFHHRSPTMWPFICITKLYVDKWAAARDDIKLALKVLLDATFKHELGHWYCTLRVGTFAQAFLDAAKLPEPERQIELASFPSPVLRSMDEKNTPKSLNTTWVKGIPEAGNFVEYQGHGGIITFSTRLNKAIIQTGPNISHILDKPYLEARHHKSQLHFVPSSGLPQAKGSIRKPKANASPQFSGCSPFAPDDGCPQIGMQMTSNTLVGLGITFTSNAGPRTRCERHIDVRRDVQEILHQREQARG